MCLCLFAHCRATSRAYVCVCLVVYMFMGARGCIHFAGCSDSDAGLVVKVSASGAEDPGFKSRLQQDFSRSSHTSDLKIGAPVATLPGAWLYRVNTGTGWPVSVYSDKVR